MHWSKHIRLEMLVTFFNTQKNYITFIQRLSNVSDVGPTLYNCYTNVLCLLGMTQNFESMLVKHCSSVYDVGPTKKQH